MPNDSILSRARILMIIEIFLYSIQVSLTKLASKYQRYSIEHRYVITGKASIPGPKTVLDGDKAF